MTRHDEKVALQHVRESLSARYPTVAEDTVRRVVEEVYATLDGPVRDYIPLLVERRARERLGVQAQAGGTPGRTSVPPQ